MANHSVTLTYVGNTFKADPDPVLVKQGDTIAFSLGNAPPGCTFKITMGEPSLFSASGADNSKPTITVQQTLSGQSAYHCQLLDPNGNTLFRSTETQPGGVVRPG